MILYIIRRFIYMVILLAVISVVAFVIIQLPPGDYITSYIMQLEATGQIVDEAEAISLRKQYGLQILKLLSKKSICSSHLTLPVF